MLKFDVFGRYFLGVERRGETWHVFMLGNEGKRRDAEVVIPPELPPQDVAAFLAEIFHEAATPDRNEVRQL